MAKKKGGAKRIVGKEAPRLSKARKAGASPKRIGAKKPTSLSKLIAMRELGGSAVQDALESAIASATGAAIKPGRARLFRQTLRDLGLARKDIAALRSHLLQRLPDLTQAIGEIPDNPGITAGDVARLLALGVAPRAREDVREWPKLEAFAEGAMAASRKAVADRYGKAFADKATDALCQVLATVATFAAESSVSRPRPTILEFSSPSPTQSEILGRAMTLGGTLLETLTSRAEGVPAALLRQARRQVQRDRFAQQVAHVISYVEKKAQRVFAAGLEAMASPTTPSSVVEICWLNGTVRTYIDPRSLAEIAADPKLQRLDLPRQLRRDLNVSGPRVGAPAFRQRFQVTGEHITVAVIDSEVDIAHPALSPRVIPKANFTRELFGSPDSHGTAVAGIIGSSDAQFPGMAPGVTLTNYKVLATRDDLNADDFGGALAIQQALEDGAQIANCSWGAGPAGNGTSREALACNTAWDLGLIIVKSAGNRGPGASTLTTPADADGIIVVGASDRTGQAVQDFSSRGPAGARIRPHLVAPGGTEFEGIVSCLVGGGFGDAGFGTSFAAPHVAGLAAVLLARNPQLEPDQVRQTVIDCCTRLAVGDNNMQGNGFVSLDQAT